MDNRKIRGMAIAAIAMATLTATGCATVPGPYPYYPAPRAQSVEMGVVEGVRPLQFQGPSTGLGAVSGAALGGWAGSGIGAGSGNAAAIVGGVILGSIIGNAVELEGSKRPGVEVTVRLDAGRTISVVQDAAPGEAFRPGDRIRVVSDGYHTRIVY